MILSGFVLNILIGLGTKLLTERFISRGILIAFREISKRTNNDWDDNLLKLIRDEIAPDMQLDQPKDWVIHESTEVITIPSEPVNISERKIAI